MGKIFKSRQYVITKELFYEMFNKRVGRLNPYVSTTKMNSFFNGITKYKYSKAREWKGVEREYMSLLRILSRYYLTKIHILCVFNKLRMQNLSRKFHIQGIRKILEVITRWFDYYSSNFCLFQLIHSESKMVWKVIMKQPAKLNYLFKIINKKKLT